MNWVKVIEADELEESERKLIKLGEQTILLMREKDRFYAVSNQCPHLKLPLLKGKVTADNSIVCPWHRSEFDLTTGEVKEWSSWPPGLGKLLGCLKRETALTVFPVKMEEGGVWVGLD